MIMMTMMMMMMMMMMMNIMVDNSETLLDGYMQTKPSLYAATNHLEPAKPSCWFLVFIFFSENSFWKNRFGSKLPSGSIYIYIFIYYPPRPKRP